jgi:hypothetical protein
MSFRPAAAGWHRRAVSHRSGSRTGTVMRSSTAAFDTVFAAAGIKILKYGHAHSVRGQRTAQIEGTSDQMSDAPGARLIVDVAC